MNDYTRDKQNQMVRERKKIDLWEFEKESPHIMPILTHLICRKDESRIKSLLMTTQEAKQNQKEKKKELIFASTKSHLDQSVCFSLQDTNHKQKK